MLSKKPFFQMALPHQPVFLMSSEDAEKENTMNPQNGGSNSILVMQHSGHRDDKLTSYILSCQAMTQLNSIMERYSVTTTFGCVYEDKGLKRCLFIPSHNSVPLFVTPRDITMTTFLKKENGCYTQKDGTEYKLCSNQRYLSPAFQDVYFTPVCQSIGRAFAILTRLSSFSEVRDALALAASEMNGDLDVSETKLSHPFVVIESVDSVQQTDMATTFGHRCNARYMKPVPECLSHLREFFDRQPEIVKQAFYCLAFYVTAGHVVRACQITGVVMDGFWHGSAARAIAAESSCKDQPGEHPTYRWPANLLKPHVVLFVGEKEPSNDDSVARSATYEERKTVTASHFKCRLFQAYRYMTLPGLDLVFRNKGESDVMMFYKILQVLKCRLSKPFLKCLNVCNPSEESEFATQMQVTTSTPTLDSNPQEVAQNSDSDEVIDVGSESPPGNAPGTIEHEGNDATAISSTNADKAGTSEEVAAPASQNNGPNGGSRKKVAFPAPQDDDSINIDTGTYGFQGDFYAKGLYASGLLQTAYGVQARYDLQAAATMIKRSHMTNQRYWAKRLQSKSK